MVSFRWGGCLLVRVGVVGIVRIVWVLSEQGICLVLFGVVCVSVVLAF